MVKKKVDKDKSLRIVRIGYWLVVPIIILMGATLAIGAPDEVGGNLSFISMFLIIFFLFGYLGFDKNLKDERLGKIASRAMTTSWGFTLLTVSGLATLRASYLPTIDGGQILGIIIVVLVSSMAISNEIYKRKGDTDW
jgi:hypothetical protein